MSRRIGNKCDYTFDRKPWVSPRNISEPIVVHYAPCLHADLSPQGVSVLVRAFTECTISSCDSHAQPRFTDLVRKILGLADVDLHGALEEFNLCFQTWLPIMPQEALCGFGDDISQQDSCIGGVKRPILWLCLWLLTKGTCSNRNHIVGSGLYRAIKQITVIFPSLSDFTEDLLRINLLIAVFELGHGLHVPAYHTMTCCSALVGRLIFHGPRNADCSRVERIQSLGTGVLTLDW